ncbi:MAG: hypothetical protein SVM80_09520 [Halobacteriota archaeon]|nr:hypothetical protein [Halobacteriota archaeon]
MEYEELGEQEFNEDEDVAPIEDKECFIGICDRCGKDVDERDSILCPDCGSVYHEWCVKHICFRCSAEIIEAA